MPTPVPTTVVTYPSWWADATTVQINFASFHVDFAPSDVEFFPWGVSFPDGPSGSGIAATLVPWGAVSSIVKTA